MGPGSSGDDGNGSSGYHDPITNYPEVKYPPGSDYVSKYPKLTEYLRNKLPTIKDNQTIINAIKKYTSLTTEEIASDLEFGKGPIVKTEQLDDACPTCDEHT